MLRIKQSVHVLSVFKPSPALTTAGHSRAWGYMDVWAGLV